MIVDDWVCVGMTWHDYPSLVEGETGGRLLVLCDMEEILIIDYKFNFLTCVLQFWLQQPGVGTIIEECRLLLQQQSARQRGDTK